MLKTGDLHVNFSPHLVVAGHDIRMDKGWWAKHVIDMLCWCIMGGNNKIKLVIKKWKKERMCVIVSSPPHCRESKKENKGKKCPSFFISPWPNVLRKKEKQVVFFGSSWPNWKEEEGSEAIGHLRSLLR